MAYVACDLERPGRGGAAVIVGDFVARASLCLIQTTWSAVKHMYVCAYSRDPPPKKKMARKKEAFMQVVYLENGLDTPGRLDLGDLERRIALAIGLESHLYKHPRFAWSRSNQRGM